MDAIARSLDTPREWLRDEGHDASGGDGACSWGPNCSPNSGFVVRAYTSRQGTPTTCRQLEKLLVGSWARVDLTDRSAGACAYTGPVGDFSAELKVIAGPPGSRIRVQVRMCPDRGGYC
jgi:hypothetical protein